MFNSILAIAYVLISSSPDALVYFDQDKTCNLLVIEMVSGAAKAAAQADACGDYELKVQQSRLAMNIAIAIGIDEGAVGQSFYREYAAAKASSGACDFERMIAVSEAFNDKAEKLFDYCGVIAP
ncbi:MAG: hypothetical protein QM744_16265 [Mesorhizobium sp.]